MLAAGYEQLRKFVEAAAEYQAAAKAARFDQDRQRYESLAANAYLLGGRKRRGEADLDSARARTRKERSRERRAFVWERCWQPRQRAAAVQTQELAI